MQFSLIAVVPSWLRTLSTDIISSSKNYASRLRSEGRKFGFIQSGSPDEFKSLIWCVGPYVQQLAWDLTFSVPIGGFRYGDIDPITGLPFSGGVNPRNKSTYVVLEDKPQIEGVPVKAVARTYSKKSGSTITKVGFFSQSLRTNIGTDVVLSSLGKRNLENLALGVGVQMAHAIGNQIKFECARQGLSCWVQGPDIITSSF
jgi:hypothetical protein